MCVVSNIGDDYSRRDKWPLWPEQYPFPDRTPVTIPENGTSFRISQLEKNYEELRSQVEQMKRELEAAKKQDEEDGNPDCEMEDKIVILRKIAAALGVDLSEVFPNE